MDRVDSELGGEERPALGVGQLPVDEHPTDEAMHADLVELVDAVDVEWVSSRLPRGMRVTCTNSAPSSKPSPWISRIRGNHSG